MKHDQLADSMEDRWHMLQCFTTGNRTEALFIERATDPITIEVIIEEPTDENVE